MGWRGASSGVATQQPRAPTRYLLFSLAPFPPPTPRQEPPTLLTSPPRPARPPRAALQIFCPRCEDIYFPRSEYQSAVDGAYFGTTFPHLLLMTYPMYRPPKATNAYVPKVFGFKLHPTAYGAK